MQELLFILVSSLMNGFEIVPSLYDVDISAVILKYFEQDR